MCASLNHHKKMKVAQSLFPQKLAVNLELSIEEKY